MQKNIFWKLSIGLFLLTIIRLVVSAFIPLSPDEAYYWVWSKQLDYSFYDHPPMVALWIKMGCFLWGDTSLGVRFMAPIAAFFGSFFVFFATIDFSKDTQSSYKNALYAVLLLNATLAVGIGGVTMTPDTPLLFFTCFFLWGCGRLVKTSSSIWWWVVGVAAGLSLLSKYTALLLIMSLGLWCLLTKQGRVYLRCKELWCGLVVTACVFSPVILWNACHQWVSFMKQGGRASDWNPHRALQFLSELLGGQIGLSTPIIFICFCIGFYCLTRAVFRQKESPDILLWLMIAVPACIFVQHAFGDRVQANWVGILYPALSIMAGIYTHVLLKSGIILGNLLVVPVYLQAIFHFIPLPAKIDMTLKRMGGWQELADQINQFVPKTENILTDEYGLSSELRFYIPQRKIFSVDRRWQYFDLPRCTVKADCIQSGYLIRTQRRKDMPPKEYFSSAIKLGVIDRKRGKIISEKYNIYKVILQPSIFDNKDIVLMP